MSNIGLIGCCRRKLPHAAPARELYCSPLFRLASRYCEATYDFWFVLSAEHGLLAPEDVIAPYDLTLRRRDRTGRAAWAQRVVGQLRRRDLLDTGHRFFLHAGALYAEPLAHLLNAEQPLRGLGIGRRLSWYRRRFP